MSQLLLYYMNFRQLLPWRQWAEAVEGPVGGKVVPGGEQEAAAGVAAHQGQVRLGVQQQLGGGAGALEAAAGGGCSCCS